MSLEPTIISYQEAGYASADIVQKFFDLTGIDALLELIAAQGAYRQIQIMSIVLSTDTAAIFTIMSGTDIIQTIALGANTTHKDHDALSPLFGSNANGNISITPSVEIANGGIYIQYRILGTA